MRDKPLTCPLPSCTRSHNRYGFNSRAAYSSHCMAHVRKGELKVSTDRTKDTDRPELAVLVFEVKK